MFHVSLLVAPAFAIAFAVLCVLRNAGPGAIFLALVALLAFVVVQPLVQLALRRSNKYVSKPWDAWFISMLCVVLPIAVLMAVGMFSFW